MKLVSTSTEYGGRSASLYWKNSDDATWGLIRCCQWEWFVLKGGGGGKYISRTISSSSFFFVLPSAAFAWLAFRRESRDDIMRFTWANFLVFLAFPIVAMSPVEDSVDQSESVLWGREKCAKRFVRTGKTLIRPTTVF